jgi:hypothetical protein
MYRMCRLDSFRGASLNLSNCINAASSSSFGLRSMDTMNVIKCVHWINKVHDIDMGLSIETIGRLLAIQSCANSRNGGNPTLSSRELGLDDNE